MTRKAYIATGLIFAASIPAFQWLATSPGKPRSMSGVEIFWLYWLAPFFVIAALAVSIIACIVLLLQLRGGRPTSFWVHLRGVPADDTAGDEARETRGWLVAVIVVGLALYSAAWAAPLIRLKRLQAHVAPLTLGAEAYLAGRAVTIPQLRIRGCSELKLLNRPRSLRAECARGFAEWDELVFDPDGNYPEPGYSKLGVWAYRWD